MTWKKKKKKTKHLLFLFITFLNEFSLCLFHCTGQMFLMNRFFDGAFLTFGIDVLRFLESDQEDRVDPMIYVFPRMTKCTFYKYGVSGEVERHDAVCILPLNVVNEKIYVFLWFWFLFLGLLSLVTVLYRVCIITYSIIKISWLLIFFYLIILYTGCHYFFATNEGLFTEVKVSPGKARSSRDDSTSK